MRATEMLKREHRVIEQVLGFLETVASDCKARGELDVAAAEQCLEFLRTFADQWHHSREEERLFPLMEQRGFSASAGPLGVMHTEHEQGRTLLRELSVVIPHAGPGTRDQARRFVELTTTYVKLLREHIGKEDECLFSMAEGAFSEEDRKTLVEQFLAAAAADAAGPRRRAAGLELAAALAAHFGVAPVALATD